jgi:hypothetical protein
MQLRSFCGFIGFRLNAMVPRLLVAAAWRKPWRVLGLVQMSLRRR